MNLARENRINRPADGAPRRSRSIGGALVLGLVAGLIISGCAQTPLRADAPVDARKTVEAEARQREQRQYETMSLLDRFAAQLHLRRLAQTYTLRSEHVQATQRTYDQVKLRSDKGVGRRTDLDVVSVALSKAGIELLEAAAALKSGLANYEARYHQRFEKAEFVAPVWNKRWPAHMAEMVDLAPAAEKREASFAWQRARRATDRVALQNGRAKLLDAVRSSYAQQFAIGQRTLGELLGMDQDYTSSKIELAGAHTELLNAQATALALLGRLQSDDLPAVPKPGAPSLGLVFDPGEPSITLKALSALPADPSRQPSPALPVPTGGDGKK
jgi:hypothetical protein